MHATARESLPLTLMMYNDEKNTSIHISHAKHSWAKVWLIVIALLIIKPSIQSRLTPWKSHIDTQHPAMHGASSSSANIQPYSKTARLANYNTCICLSISLDFLCTCWDVGCCGPCYLRPVWHGSVRTGHTAPCCNNAGLFNQGTHNDAAVPVPKVSLFSRPPPFLHEMGGLAGSHCHPDFECRHGALDAQVRVWGVFMWYR